MPMAKQYPRMAKKHDTGETKPKPSRTGFKYVRVRNPAATIAAGLAKADLKNLTDWVNDAVIERLRSLGKWPPPAS